jgi:hypothetical protein
MQAWLLFFLTTHVLSYLFSYARACATCIAAMGNPTEMIPGLDGQLVPQSAPWGIISIKPQLEDYETPMTPITVHTYCGPQLHYHQYSFSGGVLPYLVQAMRNALSKSEGGSGVALDREQYLAAVRFWSDHAMISSH